MNWSPKGVVVVQAGSALAGRYRLEQRIGSGGMGEVWRAFDRVLGRTVAVKRMRLPDEPSFIDRFRAEARTMATVSHPGVVEVYDFGDDPEAGMYLVMKYIEGESLAQALARSGRLSAEVTMRLIAEAAEALHAAHRVGVTHRDVKPGNLLVRPDGSTLLTDFGIARTDATTGHTGGATLIGTAGYIAPERVNGHLATAQSDLYSLGVVAYQCLAGRLPFTGDSLVEVAMRHIHEDPPPLPADVPPRVDEVVRRAMAKDPAARWPSGAEFAAHARRALEPVPAERHVGVAAPVTQRQALEPLTADEPITAGQGARRRLAIVAAVLTVAIVAAVAFILNRGNTPSDNLANPNGGITSPSGDAGSTASAGPAATPSGASPKPVTTSASLAPPKNLTATPIGSSAIRLRWSDDSSEEEGFTITDGVTSRNVGANTTAYDWDGLPPATYSCFKVRSFKASEVSPYHPAGEGDWVCATSQPGVGPAAPANLTATASNPNTVLLQWTDNSGDEDGFTITNGAESRNASANATGFDWNGLSPGTHYCFKIRSYHESGVSAYYPPAQADWVCITTPVT